MELGLWILGGQVVAAKISQAGKWWGKEHAAWSDKAGVVFKDTGGHL